MKKINRWLMGVIFLLGISPSASFARTDGFLVVGTQAEVKLVLSEHNLTPRFQKSDPEAVVAVAFAGGKMTIHEDCDCIAKILDSLGDLAHGVVVITLKVGSELWDCLMKHAGVVIDCGVDLAKEVLKALCDAGHLVVDGVKWVACTASQILKLLFDTCP